MSELLKPYCDVKEEDGICYLNFHESDWRRALAAIAEHEKIGASQIVYLV